MIVEFIGLPASGKSSICNRLEVLYRKNGFNVITRNDIKKKFKDSNKFYKCHYYLSLFFSINFYIIQFNNIFQKVPFFFKVELLRWTLYEFIFFKFAHKQKNNIILLDESIYQRFLASILLDSFFSVKLPLISYNSSHSIIYLEVSTNIIFERLENREPILRFKNQSQKHIEYCIYNFESALNKLVKKLQLSNNNIVTLSSNVSDFQFDNIHSLSRPFFPSNYILFSGKIFPYFNNDSPKSAYKNKNLSFVAQPLFTSKINEKFNVRVIPLVMSDEWNLINNKPNLLTELRQNKKKFEFSFVGNCSSSFRFSNFFTNSKKSHRKVYKNLKIPNYDFEDTSPIFNLPQEEKNEKLVRFLHRISMSKFVFCPRGTGTSSFRIYQSMMVGSIPIITGGVCFPFEDRVNWDQICIHGATEDLGRLINIAINLSEEDYFKMRHNAMKFWDHYCKHDNLYNYLSNLV